MSTKQCGTLDVAFCKSNPALIHDGKPAEYKPEKSVTWLLKAYPYISLVAVTYSGVQFAKWVVELGLRVVG